MTEIFLKIAGMSATACLVIVVVLILRLALRKMPKTFSYILWAAVFFRLLCPFTFESPVGVKPLEVTTAETGEIAGAVSADSVSEQAPLLTVNYEDGRFIIAAAPLRPAAETQRKASAPEILSYIWAAGAAGMLIFALVSYIRLRVRLRGAVHVDCCRISDKIKNPFILGVFRPKIYVPDGVSEEQLGYILLHEKTHIKSLDHIVKLLMYAALCLHWFNPLAWLAFRLCELDMEMSCDRRVTAKMSAAQKADYSQTLLNISAARTAVFAACFGEHRTKTRILSVLRGRNPARWLSAVCAVCVAAATVFMVTSRKAPEKPAAERPTAAAPSDDDAYDTLNLYESIYSTASLTDDESGRAEAIEAREKELRALYNFVEASVAKYDKAIAQTSEPNAKASLRAQQDENKETLENIASMLCLLKEYAADKSMSIEEMNARLDVFRDSRCESAEKITGRLVYLFDGMDGDEINGYLSDKIVLLSQFRSKSGRLLILVNNEDNHRGNEPTVDSISYCSYSGIGTVNVSCRDENGMIVRHVLTVENMKTNSLPVELIYRLSADEKISDEILKEISVNYPTIHKGFSA